MPIYIPKRLTALVFLLLFLLFLLVAGSNSEAVIVDKCGYQVGSYCLEGQYQVVAKSGNVRTVRRTDQAACRSYEPSPIHLEFTGEVTGSAVNHVAQALENVLATEPACSRAGTTTRIGKGIRRQIRVFLESPGGFMHAGIAIGRLFRQYRVQTIVVNNALCASSCAIAFLGGSKRSVQRGGIVMFHAPYLLVDQLPDELKRIHGRINRKDNIACSSYYADGELGSYFTEMMGRGYKAKLLLKNQQKYCGKNDGYYLNYLTALNLGVANSRRF